MSSRRVADSMFRRKDTSEIDGEICPYCEFVNAAGSTTCAQCYYDLNKAPRDQGEPLSAEVSDSIFDELMSDEDDSWEETEALDVVLTLDQAPVEVDQYATTDFSSEEPENIGFMESSSPELNETVAHEPVAVSAEDIGEVPTEQAPRLDFGNHDPLAEVPEPVHQGKGAVFSPNSPSKMDDDLMGHVGGSELPSLPSDDLYENRIDLTAMKGAHPPPAPVVEAPAPAPVVAKAPAPTPETALPAVATPAPEPVVAEPTPVAEPAPQPTTPAIVLPESPVIQQGIWPWVASEPWDPRQVHREVVTALEQVKSGNVEQATQTIDSLGPHLSDENVDLIYHVGMVLKQIGRVDEVKQMLERAKSAMPDNEHVSSAVAHLGV